MKSGGAALALLLERVEKMRRATPLVPTVLARSNAVTFVNPESYGLALVPAAFTSTVRPSSLMPLTSSAISAGRPSGMSVRTRQLMKLMFFACRTYQPYEGRTPFGPKEFGVQV